MKARPIKHPLVKYTVGALFIGLFCFISYTAGYEKKVEFYEAYVNNPWKVTLPVAVPAGSEVEVREL